jgi:transposase
MYQIKLTEKELEKVRNELNSEHDQRIWKRLRTLWLRSREVSSKEISKILGVTPRTISNWMKLYTESGLSGLTQLKHKGSTSILSPYTEEINQLTKEYQIPTLSVLQEQISDKFGVEIGETGLYKWCKKNSIYLSRKLD